jgi:hypothetical protein
LILQKVMDLHVLFLVLCMEDSLYKFFYTKFGRILFTCSFDPLGFNWILVIQVGVSAPNFAVGKADSKFF